jgi:hypothetical protein
MLEAYGTGSTTTPAHEAAPNGDFQGSVHLVSKQENLVHAEDLNGWTTTHEGARGGHFHHVNLLYDKGGDVNHRGNGERGGSPFTMRCNGMEVTVTICCGFLLKWDG